MVTLSGPTSLDSGMDIHPIITFLKEGDGGRGRERKRAKERGRKEERGRRGREGVEHPLALFTSTIYYTYRDGKCGVHAEMNNLFSASDSDNKLKRKESRVAFSCEVENG